MSDENPLSPGKTVLLRALDNITEIEEQTGGTVEYLMVTYAVCSTDEDGDRHTTRGWDGTDHPGFVLTGLLREVAAFIEAGSTSTPDDPDPDR